MIKSPDSSYQGDVLSPIQNIERLKEYRESRARNIIWRKMKSAQKLRAMGRGMVQEIVRSPLGVSGAVSL